MAEAPRFEVFASGLDHPECVAIDRHGHVWAGGEAGQVYQIDASGTVQTITTLGGFNAGIAFSPLGHALYVCNAKLGARRKHGAEIPKRSAFRTNPRPSSCPIRVASTVPPIPPFFRKPPVGTTRLILG